MPQVHRHYFISVNLRKVSQCEGALCPCNVSITVAPHLAPHVSYNLLCSINCTLRCGGQELNVSHHDGGEHYSGTLTTWYTVLYCTL